MRLFQNGEEDDQIDENLLDLYDDKNLLQDSNIKKVYLKLKNRNDKNAAAIKELIRKYYKKEGDGYITFDEFKQYFIRIVTIHQRCGDSCPHLRRFFAKVGITTNKYKNRRELKPAK
jgi:AraC-like DNA-binding protein